MDNELTHVDPALKTEIDDSDFTESGLKNAERGEEIQAIIERMPTSFVKLITCFIVALVILFFAMGWIIRYPDIVTGEIIMNTQKSTVKLIANTSGRLQLLNFNSQDNVKEGDYLAIIQNPANLQDVFKIDQLVANFSIQDSTQLPKLGLFPKNVSLGELNIKYTAFINAANLITNYKTDNLFDRNDGFLKKQLADYRSILDNGLKRLKMGANSLELAARFRRRDSILFKQKVLTEAEDDRAQVDFNTSKDNYQGMLKDLTIAKGQIKQIENQIQQNILQKKEKHKQLNLDLIATFLDLQDNIKAWKEKYTFRAPMSGKVQFMKFLTQNQFVQAGEPLFTIVPKESKIIGQMTLPENGAGKVKPGQEVIIKLDNYPYVEYGSITGKVSDIALTPNLLITQTGSSGTYLVNVELPNGLKTNYGAILNFKFETRGTGGIVTKDRRLIERLFDNMSYALKK